MTWRRGLKDGSVNLLMTPRLVEGCCRLQRDIDRMQSWAEKWHREFNPGKCEVIHFGRKIERSHYSLSGSFKWDAGTMYTNLRSLLKRHTGSLAFPSLITKAMKFCEVFMTG